MRNFVVETESKEILRTLLRMSSSRSPLTVWQNTGDKRIIHQCIIQEVDVENNRFYVTSGSDNSRLKFMQDLTFYFRGKDRSILFKQSVIRNSSKFISAPIPSEVRIIENRMQPRTHYGARSDKYSFFLKKDSGMLTKKEFAPLIYDASIGGLSFLVSNRDAKLLYQGDDIQITNIGNLQVDHLSAQIVYIKKITYVTKGKKHSAHKMGIKFERTISDEELKLI